MSSLPDQQNRPLPHLQRGSSPAKTALFLRQWYSLSAPPEVPENANFLAREQFRRGRVASMIILGTFAAAILLVPIILLAAPNMFILPWTIASTAMGVFCCLVAIPLNRAGKVQLAGMLLLIAVDVIVAGIVLSERNGLDPLFLSMFDLLVVSELIAASLLAPASVFAVAFANTILIILDINLQPRSMMWMQMVMSQQLAYSLLARSIVLYLVVAAVAYLWVRSALNALQRADHAELIVELERREAEQKKLLEQEIEQILRVHVRVANGDLNTRASTSQDNALWQIGIALNNLLARFKSALQAERNLRSTMTEISQLHLALNQWQSGQPLQWHPSRATLLNPLVADFRRALTRVPASNASSLPTPPSTRQEEQPIEPLASWPGSVPFRQKLPHQDSTRPGFTRPGTSQNTPLPDNSGFFIQQGPGSQVPDAPRSTTLDRQNSTGARTSFTRPGTSQNTPLPDNSGFFIQQEP